MECEKRAEAKSLLEILPPVDFCCIYGSILHPNNLDKTSMIDYIIGVQDPQQWHTKNLKMNQNHYASWMMHLGGARLITNVADVIGVGVHFNPFVAHNDKTFKYGVVRVHDLIQDILGWERFYLGGRLQKPVNILVDNLDIGNLNCVNLKAATSAALLLLPSKFSEEELYFKICSLSYMGDLRMHFAEDRNKVKKIVHGQLKLFQTMYKPFLEEYAAKHLLRLSLSGDNKVNITQDCGLSTSRSLISYLPQPLRSQMGTELGEKKRFDESGRTVREVVIKSKEEAAECMQKILRRKVMVSSARQAVAGLLTVGVVHGFQYLGNKMRKAWKSWT
ncbi:phosphatidate cytidylyltransferase, mitochondrial isoform X1 [Olea europaea var. sylvestris]|uniref:phosphatidate cytidylyltransferase, mitochondrial isoform X1 n=1 Tax=Olea europaea var. sylvestris TaxID=158386 RepID=UPI000C1D4376|nr:phosphatidate cytidylyltransferase, mitochondrial isoform X1 [Olea europaea var. sylvestris]